MDDPQSLYPVAPPYYKDQWIEDIWPDLRKGHVVLAAPRVGMNAHTGAIMVGWPHVEQSIGKIFATRFHERVLRRWVGSFIPHILGELATLNVLTRFYWAISTAIDLWEPCYRVLRIRVMRRRNLQFRPDEREILTSAEEMRTGQLTTVKEGIFMPRGHLGDFTPEQRRAIALVARGSGEFSSVAF
jgi:phage baseplate assembly protein W